MMSRNSNKKWDSHLKKASNNIKSKS